MSVKWRAGEYLKLKPSQTASLDFLLNQCVSGVRGCRWGKEASEQGPSEFGGS